MNRLERLPADSAEATSANSAKFENSSDPCRFIRQVKKVRPLSDECSALPDPCPFTRQVNEVRRLGSWGTCITCRVNRQGSDVPSAAAIACEPLAPAG